jgi:outer membrane protein OmpA-like peptidoglycan-associated protein
MKRLISLMVPALLVGACATTPTTDPNVDQAAAAIDTLAQDPLAQQAASQDLVSARARLQDAQAALAQHKPLAEVDHLAYLAQRHAEAGEARVEEAHARVDLASAQSERDRILLESRNRQAQNAQEAAYAARAQAAEAQSQAAAAQSQLAQSQQELADLKAQQTNRGMVVTLSDVLFDTNQATLKPGADLSLDHLATFMSGHPRTKVIIEGHTDSTGSDAYNDDLSQRRADAVARALVARGVDPADIRAIGRGKNYPVATNDTSAGRQQNRRVEIVFSDASGRFAQSETDQSIRR